jgi:competence protein ComEA
MDWRQHQQIAQTAFLQPAAKAVQPVTPPPPTAVAMKQRAISNKININSASAKELERLPRVGPVMAQRILSFRKEHGPFQSVEDLRQIKGIGEKTLARIRDRITIE